MTEPAETTYLRMRAVLIHNLKPIYEACETDEESMAFCDALLALANSNAVTFYGTVGGLAVMSAHMTDMLNSIAEAGIEDFDEFPEVVNPPMEEDDQPEVADD